jgi:CheY-like chemotaxis protein
MEKKKIMIVDDEERFAQMIKLNLETTGQYKVRIETEGEKALPAAQEFQPDLIFLDVMMPGLDGGDVAKQIKDDKDLKNTPIVFLTAIVSENEVSSKHGERG